MFPMLPTSPAPMLMLSHLPDLKSLIFSDLSISLTGPYKNNRGQNYCSTCHSILAHQSWLAQVSHLVVDRPRILPHPPPLSFPWNQDLLHPISKEMHLISVTLSGGDSSPNSVTHQPLLYSLDHLKKIPSPNMDVKIILPLCDPWPTIPWTSFTSTRTHICSIWPQHGMSCNLIVLLHVDRLWHFQAFALCYSQKTLPSPTCGWWNLRPNNGFGFLLY